MIDGHRAARQSIGSMIATFLARRGFDISSFGGMLAVLGYPLSVSLSQGGLFLALLGWVLHAIGHRLLARSTERYEHVHPNVPELLRWTHHPVLYAAVGIYAMLLLSLLLTAAVSSDFSTTVRNGLGMEIKDGGLLLAAFWALAFARHPLGRERLEKWIRISIILLLVTGFASIWSRYRLSKIPELIANDWQVGPDVRYQHHLGTFFAGTPYQVHFYMPIGLMNTHLTYAGLLMLAFPYLLLRVVDPFVRAPRALLKPNMIVPLLSLAVLLILMVLNNGRSALLGMGVAALVGMYFFIRHYWKWKVVRLLPILGVALLSFGVLVHFSDSMHYRFARIMNALTGESKHTDHQRTLVWNGTFELIQAHPFIGVGAGNFEKNIIQHVGTFGQEHPRLWIPYALAQRGHAHSDIFHLFAIGGPLSAGFYLLFFGLLMYHLTDAGGLNRNGYLRWAPIGMLFAGLLQCYFQDDEVLLPFWIYTGLILGGIRNHTSASETMNDKSDMGPAD